MTRGADTLMPPEAPLAMPAQDFASEFRDGNAPGTEAPARLAIWRWLAFAPAVVGTAGLTWVMQDWFSDQGFSTLEIVLLTLIAFNFFWICFTARVLKMIIVDL